MAWHSWRPRLLKNFPERHNSARVQRGMHSPLPGEDQMVPGIEICPGARRLSFAVDDISQPGGILNPGPLQPKTLDPERRHLETQEVAATGINAGEIGQHKAAPKFFVSGNALIVIEE